MGKMDRLRNRVEPFAALPCSQYCTCHHLTLPAGPVSLHRQTQSMFLYGHSWLNSYLGMLFIYEVDQKALSSSLKDDPLLTFLWLLALHLSIYVRWCEEKRW